MNDLVSVIVPIYNAEKYLDRCVKSIINQSYQNIEVILVDDGSTDRSAAICVIWKNRDSRVKYCYQKNTGVSGARNFGLANISGQYIIFVDADDYLDETYIQKLMLAERESRADIIISNAIDVYDDNTTKMADLATENLRLTRDEAVDHFLKGDLFTPVCWGRLYRKKCIESIKFDTSMRIAEDGKFFLDAINNCDSVYVIAERLYFYYIRPGSAVHEGFNSKYYDELKFCEDLVETYKAKYNLNVAAQMKLYRFTMRLLEMKDLPLSEYRFLCSKLKHSYDDIKPYLSIKEKIKFALFSNLILRNMYIKVKI